MLIHNGLRSCLRRTPIRGMANHARSTLKVALLPADGIGREVIPVRTLHSLHLAHYLAVFAFSADTRLSFVYLSGCQGCIGGSGFRFTQARIRRSARWLRVIHKNGHSPPSRHNSVCSLIVMMGTFGRLFTGPMTGPCGNKTALCLVPSGLSLVPSKIFGNVRVLADDVAKSSSPSKRVFGYSSPIVALRKELDLYANIRPVISVRLLESRSLLPLLTRAPTD